MRIPRFRRRAVAHAVACALAVASLGAATDATARLTRFVADPAVPAFGGATISAIGTSYDKITGWAYGELDPADPLNAVIVDIQNAPRNARGMVEYGFNFYILKPHDLSKGAHKLYYEAPNRGGKLSGGLLKLASGNDPGVSTTGAQAQNGFLTTRGYTMAWSGWDFAGGTDASGNKSIINLPVARNKDGSSITGPAYEYFVTAGTTNKLPINYVPADATDKVTAHLTHRVHLDDAPQPVDPSHWNYDAAGKNVVLDTNYTPNDIYEFTYTAKDPTVNGVGFAAVRDFNSFLRYAKKDDAGNANPLAGDIKDIYTYTISQPARLLNDFRHLGFNEDENHRKVFDGIVNWIGAGDGINMNLRFSQPGRTERNRQDELYAEGLFPFSNFPTHDAITGQTDSRYMGCLHANTCPLGMEIYSANEYWVKAASLLHTTPDGARDLPDWHQARNYFMSSHQHGSGNGTRGACQQKTNPVDSTPIHRALFMDMDAWVTQGIDPPPSAVPRLDDGTLVPPDQASVGFPNIPDAFHNNASGLVTYTGLKTTRYRYNYGPRFDQGIMDINPPVHFAPYEDNPDNGPIYPSFVPKTDSDGNDIAGIRMPEVAVPTATYTGWALRSGAQANDGCESNGQWIDFPATAADRIATNDPRPSVKERYPTHDVYVQKVTDYVNSLVARRLLLQDDADAIIAKAQASTIGN